MDADKVAETLAGYERASAYIERERRERLARMTPEESRAIYDDLCAGYYGRVPPEEWAVVNPHRLAVMLEVRRTMAQLAKAQGYHLDE